MEEYPFQFQSRPPDADEDVEMSISSATRLQSGENTLTLRPGPERDPSSPQAKLQEAGQHSAVAAGLAYNQVVLHHSRRHRTSGDPHPYPNETSQKPAKAGWRPVRLQGYSEDSMKDEVIRGQTETIKLLQSQLQSLQTEQEKFIALDQRAKEAEAALQQKQNKAAEQEELIEQLRNELRIHQPNGSQRKGKQRASTYAETDTLPERTPSPSQLTDDCSMDPEPSSWRTLIGDRSSYGVTTAGPHTVQRDAPHQPRTTLLPIPLTFKRTGGRRRQSKHLPTPPPVDSASPPIWTSAAASDPSGPRSQANPMLSLEAKVDLIINTLGLSGGNHRFPLQRGRRPPASEFAYPTPRVPKPDGRNERLAWVRSQLQSLLGIGQDRDILNHRDLLYGQNTALKRCMADFEKDLTAFGPVTLEPMQVNWDVIYGRWNECLFGLFVTHCKENGYGSEQLLTEADEDEISQIFFKRLERINGIINEYRPRADETVAQADQRYSDKHLIKLSAARRNRRRGELFNTRCDINMDHLPEDLENLSHLSEGTKRWIDCYKIHQAFGIEGTSSDETDPCESDSYNVHILDWRSRDLSKKMRTADAARRTTNKYGNNRPGNRPRTRKRRPGDESKKSIRKAPAGLPINCYDEQWYNALSPKRKRDLQTKAALQHLATWESD